VASKLAEANHPVACPPQWLPVLLAANTPGPPTNHHRRLLGVFTTKAELKTAVGEYDANVAAAENNYGPIADWDVSGITDMSRLFDSLSNFDADISSWDTSSVTCMNYMFLVRFHLRLLPTLCPSWTTRTPRVLLIRPSLYATSPCHALPSAGCPLWTRQVAAAFNRPLSFDTSSVTDMSSMFDVRFRLRLLPTLPSWATHGRVRCMLLVRPFLCVPHLHATRFPLSGAHHFGLGRVRLLSTSR
jgi:surface protein